MTACTADLVPLQFDTVNLIQRPMIMAGDVIRVFARSDVPIVGAVGWQTGRASGIAASPIGILLANMATPVGFDGYASFVLASQQGRPIVCPAYGELGASLIVDLTGTPRRINQEAWAMIFPRGEGPI